MVKRLKMSKTAPDYHRTAAVPAVPISSPMKMLLGRCLALLLVSSFASKASSKKCNVGIISVTEGRLVGKEFETNKGTEFFAFLDVPYAEPPVGRLRFQEPVPIRKWPKILNATANRRICAQFDPNVSGRDARETEDCLVLNVYAPAETLCDAEQSSSPVLVFVHGGSFRSWDGAMGTFGPQYFMDEYVVMVSMNYRLGPLGFLNTGDDVIPGNLGLKDQLLALKWVSKNIKYFGGDADRVTLMGQSAGAMSVGYHLLNPQSKGLFGAAIMHSASPLSCAALQKHPLDAAVSLASEIDQSLSKSSNTTKILDILQAATLEQIQRAALSAKLPNNKMNCQLIGSLMWTPSGEPPGAKNPLVTGMNYDKAKAGQTLSVPLLIGVNSQESLYYGTSGIPLVAKLYDMDPSHMIDENLNIDRRKKRVAGQALKYLYTQTTFSSNMSAVIDFISDNYFNVPTMAFASFHSQHSVVYAYQFAYKGPLGRLNSTFPGVGHGEELNYLFQNSYNEDLSRFPEEDVAAHERVMVLWSQFIRSSFRHPTHSPSDLLEHVQWPMFQEKNLLQLRIDRDLTVEKYTGKFRNWMNIVDLFGQPQIDTF
ncbi:unnamed protein product [Phyllotreta striolata]|uniref:Carboxylic ester hydrolase n=1 Tax=Phyllotreta striolata TaxID=444603 RepID=A0A9N9TZ74_PHYSR|nr:unnamed protein product [Phyllotreta striolata]